MAQDEKEDVRDDDKADAREGDGASEEESPAKAAEISAERHAEKPGALKVHGGEHARAAHHAPNRKEYMVIFVVLFVLTVIEVAVAQVPGIGKGLLTLALVSLAVTKAAIVGLFYMHLKHETKILKLSVAIPLAFPAVYALVLIAEAAWRLTRW